MEKVESVFFIADIMEIFAISRATVHRWITAAKEGHSTFPLPVNYKVTGYRTLIWDRSAIVLFCRSSPEPQPQVNILGSKKEAKIFQKMLEWQQQAKSRRNISNTHQKQHDGNE